MRSLFLVLSRGGLLKKYAETGVIQGLAQHGARVVCIMPPSDEQDQCRHMLSGITVVFEPLRVAQPSLVRRILQEAGRAAIFNDTVSVRYRYPARRGLARISQWVRLHIFPVMRHVPYIKEAIRAIGQVMDPQREHDELFSRYRPTIVFSTTPHDESEAALLKSARRFRTPIVAMPKSWDNLPKALFPVKVSRLLVWGTAMRDDAVRLQGYDSHSVVVTGAPQFDVYAHPERCWDRAAFAALHGLNPAMKFILYGSSGADMCDEDRFLDVIAGYLSERTDVQVLIRPHGGYRGDARRFERFSGRYGFFVDRTATEHFSPRSTWDTNPKRTEYLHNALFHADVLVTIASTLTIDATLAGTPVIHLKFDVDPQTLPERSVRRIFETSYTKEMLASGATWVATDRASLYRALTETLSGKHQRLREREHLIQRFAFVNDGRAASRVVESVMTV